MCIYVEYAYVQVVSTYIPEYTFTSSTACILVSKYNTFCTFLEKLRPDWDACSEPPPPSFDLL